MLPLHSLAFPAAAWCAQGPRPAGGLQHADQHQALWAKEACSQVSLYVQAHPSALHLCAGEYRQMQAHVCKHAHIYI